MRIVTRKRLMEYARCHPKAASSLGRWAAVMKHADWRTPADMKRSFNDVDPATVASGRTVYVFNIQGNEHRLIAAVHFNTQTVFVLRLMAHPEYDKERWKDEL